MTGSLFWLSDEAWAMIEPLLPRNQPGARRVDDRRVISGIVYMLRAGRRWQDCPVAYGPPTTIYNRWHRWERRGVWERVQAALPPEAWQAETAQIEHTGTRRNVSKSHPGPGLDEDRAGAPKRDGTIREL